MQNRTKKQIRLHLALFCLLAIIIWGCATTTVKKGLSPEAHEMIATAEIYFKSLTDMKADQRYPLKYQNSREYLESAKGYAASGDSENAFDSASDSLDSSKKILRSVVVGSFRKNALALKAKILAKGDDSSLKDLLPKLDEILQYAEDIENSQKEIVLSEFLKMQEQILKIEESIQRNVTFTISNDVSFGMGDYKIEDLSEEGKKILETIIMKINAAQEKYIAKFNSQKMQIKLKVTGYSDEVPFKRGGRLMKRLLDGVADVPEGKEERRKFLNQRLSQLRANTIGQYLETQLRQLKNENLDVDLLPEYIGKGETLPPDIASPLPMNDPRRRICIVDSYCTIE